MTAGGRHTAYVLKRFPRISETFIAAELIEMARQGERVTVFALARPDEAFEHAFVAEMPFPVAYLPNRPLRQPVRTFRSVVRVLRSDGRAWLRAAASASWPPRVTAWRHLLQSTVLRNEMRLAGVDHAHAHFASMATKLAHQAHRLGGPGYSVTAHAKDIWHEDSRDGTLPERLTGATFVATVSEQNRRHLQDLVHGACPVHLVANAVDLRRLGHPVVGHREPRLVLTVARLIEKKGIEDLVAACGLLAERGRPIRLEIVGDGPLRASLAADCDRLAVDVIFHGALPQEELLPLYGRAAVFALPCVVASNGDRDGLPTAVLEAMALGLPVIVSAVNGLADAVTDGETGLVVAEHDPVGLAAALERILSDDALASRLAVAARRRVEERFDLAATVTLLRSLLPVP